jgi:hypothetical protein
MANEKNKLGITEGKVFDRETCDSLASNILADGNVFMVVYDLTHSNITRANNLDLITDTFATANLCGLLPSELLRQRDELLKKREWNSLETANNVAEDCKAYMEQHGGYHKFDEYFDYYLAEEVKKKLGIEETNSLTSTNDK